MSEALTLRIIEAVGAVNARALTKFSPEQTKAAKKIIDDTAKESKGREKELMQNFTNACKENKKLLADLTRSAAATLILSPSVEKTLAKAQAPAPTPIALTPALASVTENTNPTEE